LVLAAKGLEYSAIPLDLDNKTSFLEKLSPYRRVPVLKHKGQQIYESSIINEYLEEVFPKTSLMPKDPVQKADVRFWVDFVQVRLVSAYFNLINNEDPAQWPELADRLNKWFRFIDQRAFETLWISGSEMSLADISLYPWIERFISAERYRGASIPEDCVKLKAWINAMQSTQAVLMCAKTEKQYISFFDAYWTPLPSSNVES
jgi:glutathione S-transferase